MNRISFHHITSRKAALVALLTLLAATACHTKEPRHSDAELGLSLQQSAGRAVFDSYCLRCHEPYSSDAVQGPSLRHIMQKPYMPSGIPANDARMTDLILNGRAKMPGFGQALRDQQVTDLIAYLHTL